MVIQNISDEVINLRIPFCSEGYDYLDVVPQWCIMKFKLFGIYFCHK